tara:strand:+ start:530 stop:703 length:174 start_codon:yes stop_codon:yes gene_type:complete
MITKEKSEALLTFFINAHADQYIGLDDPMCDDCNDWISALTDDEVCELVLETFREGI